MHMDVNGIRQFRALPSQQEVIKPNAEPVDTTEKTDVNPAPRADGESDNAEQHLSEDDKQKRMQRLQDTLKNHNVEISYNEEVNRYAIKVLDADTKEVVKEIPSEKTLDMFARMLEIEGLLLDEKR